MTSFLAIPISRSELLREKAGRVLSTGHTSASVQGNLLEAVEKDPKCESITMRGGGWTVEDYSPHANHFAERVEGEVWVEGWRHPLLFRGGRVNSLEGGNSRNHGIDAPGISH